MPGTEPESMRRGVLQERPGPSGPTCLEGCVMEPQIAADDRLMNALQEAVEEDPQSNQTRSLRQQVVALLREHLGRATQHPQISSQTVHEAGHCAEASISGQADRDPYLGHVLKVGHKGPQADVRPADVRCSRSSKLLWCIPGAVLLVKQSTTVRRL